MILSLRPSNPINCVNTSCRVESRRPPCHDGGRHCQGRHIVHLNTSQKSVTEPSRKAHPVERRRIALLCTGFFVRRHRDSQMGAGGSDTPHGSYRNSAGLSVFPAHISTRTTPIMTKTCPQCVSPDGLILYAKQRPAKPILVSPGMTRRISRMPGTFSRRGRAVSPNPASQAERQRRAWLQCPYSSVRSGGGFLAWKSAPVTRMNCRRSCRRSKTLYGPLLLWSEHPPKQQVLSGHSGGRSDSGAVSGMLPSRRAADSVVPRLCPNCSA